MRFSALRGERIALPGGIALVNDCYNANPMSMRAAIDDLAGDCAGAPGGRARRHARARSRGGAGLHREVGAYASSAASSCWSRSARSPPRCAAAFDRRDALGARREAAGELLGGLLREGDTVLVKGSRGVGLERVAQVLEAKARRMRAARLTSSARRPWIWASDGASGANHPAGRR